MEKKQVKYPWRVRISAVLIGFSLLAWILPDAQKSAYEVPPDEIIEFLSSSDRSYSVDQVARIVVNEDPAFFLIDIRSREEYLDAHIPGAVNIPFQDILNPDWAGYLDDKWIVPVLYSNSSIKAAEVQVILVQYGYRDVKIMDGGMDEWYSTVMESEFTGERISAAENAKFEIRYRAREYFNTMNSLPDSLKTAYLEARRKKEAELVGGCE